MSRYDNLGWWGERMREVRDDELKWCVQDTGPLLSVLEDLEDGLRAGASLRDVWERLQREGRHQMPLERLQVQCEAVGLVPTSTLVQLDYGSAREAGLTFSGYNRRERRQKHVLAGGTGEPPRRKFVLPYGGDATHLMTRGTK